MKVKVILKSGPLYSNEDVVRVTLPTAEGIIQILPKHENLISLLKLGVIYFELGDGTKHDVVIADGVAKIQGDEVTILSDQAELASNLIKDEISQAIKLAEANIGTTDLPPSEFIQLEKQLLFERYKQKYLES